jgi:hypothetical protein
MLFVVSMMLSGCSDNIDYVFDNPLNLSRISIPASVEMASGDVQSLNGHGFLDGDVVTFIGETGNTFTATLVGVNDDGISFQLPSNIPTGKYEITITRGDATMTIGSMSIYRVFRGDIPAKEGMNVNGVVHCNGMAVPGVVVSDGVNVTTTDEDGIYYLSSNKKTGYVFISMPSGYKVSNTNGNQPAIYGKLTSDESTIDRNDFSLIEVPKDKDYVVLALADMHLAARTWDREQFDANTVPDVNDMISYYSSMGKEVWAVTLGDQSWDSYWYSNKFTLTEAIPYINEINCPVFHCMGNHDNDPNYSSDWEASQYWRDNLGPTYYSFNIGNVHYVVLDNITYNGISNYTSKIDDVQMSWLRKDLATIADKSAPLVVCMHIPLHARPSVSNGAQVDKISMASGTELVDALNGFNDVTIMTGHTHVCYGANENDGKIKEHNIGAVCATWWWTGHMKYRAQIGICIDGAPAGYGVLEVSGNKVEEYYKSVGYEKDYRFRAYDLNTVEITADKFCPDADDTRLALVSNYVQGYGTAGSSNEVLINVWGFSTGWSIDVYENGKKLDVTRSSEYDPLHIVAYEFQRLNALATPTAAMVTTANPHMFKVRASSATSNLDIKVTDCYGNVYTETMTRPKEFGYSIR